MKQKFALNQHANACKGNQKFANHLINYCYNKLLANEVDPQIAAIIAVYVLYVKDWNEGYVKWHDALNYQMSTTDEMEALDFELINTKAPLWVGKIWGVYPQGTPKATALLPHQRKPLITGSYQDKISGMNTLITGIGTDADLAAVKTDLETFVANYTETFQKHQAALEAYGTRAKDQEQLRLKATGAMLFCEGSLIAKYWKDPLKVDLFFDVEEMRNHKGKPKPKAPIEVLLDKSEIKLIDIDYTFKNIWEVTNDGTEDGCVFFGNTPTIIAIPEYKYTIVAGETLKIDLSVLPHDQRFAYAGNLSAAVAGKLTIKIIK
jgi:hypothetical protein